MSKGPGKGGWHYVLVAIAIPFLIVAVVNIIGNIISWFGNHPVIKIGIPVVGIVVLAVVIIYNKNWFKND